MQAGRVGLQSAAHGLQGGRIERPPRWRGCTAYVLSHVLPMHFPMCFLCTFPCASVNFPMCCQCTFPCAPYELSHVLSMNFPMCSLAVLAILTALTTEERVTWVAPQLSSATCTAQGTQADSLGAWGCSLGA